METINERQKNILRMIVGDYINWARPVGSAWLVRRHKMSCCSATVRHDMVELEKSGYLKQFHTSSGRIPTIVGYRYFIDHLMAAKDLPPRFRRRMSLVLGSLDSTKYSQAVKVLATEVANITDSLVIISMPEDRWYMNGMQYILNRPEFRDGQLTQRMGILLDRIDHIIADLRRQLPDGTYRVYLDDELNYDYTRDLAFAVKKFRDPFGESHIFGSVGPVRMDYQILPKLMDFASKMLEDF
ncbi:MAG: hypothetical protein WC570_01480 [Patescibacteria group bacterium]